MGTTTFSGNTATVSLSGVSDRQTITVELDNVVGITGVNSKVLVSMSVLTCDVNQSGSVTSEDIAAVQQHSGSVVDSTTFQYDTTHNGAINSSDIAQTQYSTGDSLYPDFAFTGHYYHARSGLYLAPYRAYNPTIGRWLSRDPIGEQGGLNLYAYVSNNPTTRTDSLGLCCDEQTVNRGQAQLEVAYRWISQGITHAEQLVGRRFSCQESNCQLLLPRLPSVECWECEAVHGYRSNVQLFFGGWYGIGNDHWVIVCRAHNDSGKTVREIEFDFWSGNERSVPFSDSGFRNPIIGYPKSTPP